MVLTRTFELNTNANYDTHDITEQVAQHVRESGLQNGIVTVFTPSSTSALTTIEYEPGAISDFERLFDEIATPDREYRHNLRWNDGNGHSHIRASLVGPSLTIPFAEKELLLGEWQQIMYIDFDVRPRTRRVIVQILGE